jgi:hypothetical protein
VVAGPVVPAELARRELVAEREPAAVLAAVVTVMMSWLLTPVHTDGLTRTPSAGEYFVSKGAISVGLVAIGLAAIGLAGPLLVGFTNARPSRVGMCGGTRRSGAMSNGHTTRSG